jgi:hypothetical protein
VAVICNRNRSARIWHVSRFHVYLPGRSEEFKDAPQPAFEYNKSLSCGAGSVLSGIMIHLMCRMWDTSLPLCVGCGIHLSHYVSFVECVSPVMCRMWNASLPSCVICGMHLFYYVSYVECTSLIMCRMWIISLPLCVVRGMRPYCYVSYVECIPPVMCRMWTAFLPLCAYVECMFPLYAVCEIYQSLYVSYMEKY